MAWAVTFRGSNVITSSEGMYRAKLGLVKREYNYIKLARALGLIAKDTGHSGATHQLDIVFDCTVAEALLIRARIQAFLTPVSGSLVIPDHGTFQHCLLDEAIETGCECSIVGLNSISALSNAANRGYTLEYSLTFRQLRS